MDPEAVWYAAVGNRHCVRVRAGGELLATVDLDRGAFACALSRGQDPRLFVVGQNWGGNYRTGRGIPRARTRCRKTVTPADSAVRRPGVSGNGRHRHFPIR
jgi:hypothetical protein